MALSVSDLPAIYTLLTNSLSADINVRKPAEDALVQFESRPGFCSCLMEVITAKDLVSQTDVRLLASLYFKNTVNRYWRNRRDSTGMSNEEKLHLRQKLLSHLREENYQIALTLAVLISKIARIDYPREWSDLFSILAQQLQAADMLTSHRIFMILFRTLKELSTKRLTSDQRTFAEIASQFFDYSWHLWQNDVQHILHGFSVLAQNASELHQDDVFLTCERWFLCSKIIRQLIVSGFPSDAKSIQEVQPVKKVCPVMLSAIQSFLPYYSLFHEKHPKFWDFLKKACTKLMKILIAIQNRHPYSFGDQSVLWPIVDFCLNKITNPEPDVLSFEEFLIQCMSMMKSVLECKEYKPFLTGRVMDDNRVTLQEMKKNVSSAVAGVLASLLPSDRVVLLCNILIRRYFVLTTSDVEEWYQNPEAFHHEQDSVLWSERLRPCAEALYIVLFENHSQLLGPVVVSILQEAMTGCPSSVSEISPQLLLKDAAYGAAAYVYYELSNYLSFKDWFNGALSVELTNDHPNMRIIHRKVALILGQWVSEIKDDTRRPVYCALIKLLQEKDLCLRLAASRSLYFHIEDANFSEQDFSDLLPICWDSCFKLVEEVHEFDSKVQVLNTISSLIARITEVIPYANKLVQFFQKAWEESSGESLLQIQLLTALKNFVVALGYQSPVCYNMLLPILRSLLNVNSPDELLEDSLQLWEATLTHAPSVVPDLLGYFPCLVEILERSFDHLKVAASIIEGYIVLGGLEFLNMHAQTLVKVLDLVINNVNDRGMLSILPLVDVLVQCFPAEVPQLISTTIQKLIVICLSGGDDHHPFKTAVKTSSAATLARILVMNTNFLAQLTSEPSLLAHLKKAGFPIEENILLCLVDVWLDKVDDVISTQRKAFGLALSIILTVRLPQILDKLDQILSACTSVILGGSEDLTEDESSSDNMQSSRLQVPSKELRRRQIKFSDPINQISLENSVRENLQTCAALHGELFNTAMSKMHPAALAQLKQALNMP
ncbi:Nuclear transport receptor KAP120 (importin beta superfamily) [Handroanthus impetiginosus]|uniref:Nuclear transport receptor KAP120 (Importin beta superfamily) n=1 Tax=Handroanthus impetiginosus TaxID=429701 RepID=A0A2G9HQQ3_9LAMI|nr:Nuclear transport receptor KAP120 (importin beta superfamily) [Handroanthus impetiginosus]